MKCLICSGPMAYHFSKSFDVYDLRQVDYYTCRDCGFSVSATHLEMSEVEWGKLNFAFHHDSDAREDNPYNRNQRYFNQALMLHLMKKKRLLASGAWLDWGSGSGALSRQLKCHFEIELYNFDRFMRPKLLGLSQGQLVERGYALVTNTAVFEHVRSRQTLDEIESYVAKDGAFGVHTLVRGDIPADPQWMYLLPVHCAFHTNRSMNILMHQWGYPCSSYNEQSKMWVLFRQSREEMHGRIRSLNQLLGWEYLHFKPGFVDYWP